MHFNPIKMPSLSQWLEHGIEDIEVYVRLVCKQRMVNDKVPFPDSWKQYTGLEEI